MTAPEVIYACRWLIRDTFRQARANGILWLMLALSCVAIFFCFSVSIQGERPRPADDIEVKRHGHVSIAFGAWKESLPRDGRSEMQFILLLLGEWVAGAGGTLLALIWTAGFVPEFLQPANATVLLSKPTSRWVLLLGKYLGVLCFVGFQAAVFIFGTWFAIGLKTGYWINPYLWGIPLLLLHFAAVYSFSLLLAVLTRSTLVCVVGAVFFWFLCWGINFGRHALLARQADMPPMSASLRWLTEAFYWIMPKPLDMGMILHNAIEAGTSFGRMVELDRIQQMGEFHPVLAILSGLLFTLCMIVLAGRQLSVTDY